GSGKTTSLYALLNSVNGESVNIQTIEDPIEYEIEGNNQVELTGVSVVPEPTTFALLAIAVVFGAVFVRRRPRSG
ncbi:MAG: ATPase, T2SS/T4P/T4SS family, partial [Chthoniobacterales bacterium]